MQGCQWLAAPHPHFGEFGDQAAGHRRGEQRLPGGGDADGVEEALGCRILEQEAVNATLALLYVLSLYATAATIAGLILFQLRDAR